MGSEWRGEQQLSCLAREPWPWGTRGSGPSAPTQAVPRRSSTDPSWVDGCVEGARDSQGWRASPVDPATPLAEDSAWRPAPPPCHSLSLWGAGDYQTSRKRGNTKTVGCHRQPRLPIPHTNCQCDQKLRCCSPSPPTRVHVVRLAPPPLHHPRLHSEARFPVDPTHPAARLTCMNPTPASIYT